MTLKVNAVVDRISKGKAVILIESHQKEIILDVEKADILLEPGDWLDLVLDSKDKITSMQINYTLTEERKEKVESVMDRLKKKKGSKFKR